MKKLFLLFLLFPQISVFAQTSEIDSLILKSNALFYSNPELARSYAQKASKLSKEMDYEAGVHKAIRLIGITHDIQGRTDSSKYYFELYYELSKKKGDANMITASLINLCMLHWNTGQFQEALKYGFESIKSAESNNNQSLLSKCFNNVALIYQEINDYEKAILYNKNAYQIRSDLGDEQGMVHSWNNLGICFKNLQNYDSAKYFYSQAFDLAREIGDETTISRVNNNLGVIAIEEGDYEQALSYLNASLTYQQNALQTLLTNNSIAEANLRIGNYKEALDHALVSQKLLTQIDNQDHKEDVYTLLANSYAKNMQADSAVKYFNALIAVKDSLFNEESARAYNDLEVSYQTEKKEQQIALQEAKLERDQVVILIFIILSVVGIIFFISYRRQQSRKEALIKKDAEIRIKEIELNSVITSQEKERNRFAKDLHDGFGQLISVLKLNLSQLSDVGSRETEKRQEIFKNGESVINEMYTELRNIVFDLMPQTLIKGGLGPALQELGDRINKTDKVTCEVLVFDEGPRLNEVEEISLFRITQEWVNNVLKYSGADAITIQLVREERELTLTVEDNGVGFDQKVFFEGNGNGWKNVQSRLNQIDGEFFLDSRPGFKGTMMTTNITLEALKIPNSPDKEMA